VSAKYIDFSEDDHATTIDKPVRAGTRRMRISHLASSGMSQTLHADFGAALPRTAGMEPIFSYGTALQVVRELLLGRVLGRAGPEVRGLVVC
jgi:hypothetical protein